MNKFYELFLATILKSNLITDIQHQNILSLLKANTDFEHALQQEVPNFSTKYIYDVLGELYRRQRITINEITEKFENIKRDSVDYYSLPEIKTKTIFSEYIVIKLPELSYPFVLDFKNVKKRISDYEKYKGKNIDELYSYLVNTTHNNTKITEKEYEKYYEFIEKEILYSTFYQELNKEVFELIKDLNLN